VTSGSWASFSSRSKRIITVLACFVFCVVVTIAGVLTPISAQDAKATNQDLDNIRNEIKNETTTVGLWRGALSIFQNNFIIDLIMFVPIAGPVFGSYALYNTGLALNAESNSTENQSHLSGVILFFLLFLFPHTWLEFIAYSTALAASIWLTWRIIRRGGKREIVRTGMFIAICAGLLLLGAFIEAYLISIS
jgi:uncharacterized membrane protein SpoIIM required for sporulation